MKNSNCQKYVNVLSFVVKIKLEMLGNFVNNHNSYVIIINIINFIISIISSIFKQREFVPYLSTWPRL